MIGWYADNSNRVFTRYAPWMRKIKLPEVPLGGLHIGSAISDRELKKSTGPIALKAERRALPFHALGAISSNEDLVHTLEGSADSCQYQWRCFRKGEFGEISFVEAGC